MMMTSREGKMGMAITTHSENDHEEEDGHIDNTDEGQDDSKFDSMLICITQTNDQPKQIKVHSEMCLKYL